MSSPTITSIAPAQGSTLGGGTLLIYGSDFLTGASVMIGTTACKNIIFVSDTFITADITPVKIAGVYDVTVTNADAGTVTLSAAFTAYAPEKRKPMFPYKVYLNGSDVTLLQKGRPSVVNETTILNSYNISFNNLSLNVPLEMKKLLFVSPVDNDFKIKQGDNIVYQGFLTGKSVNEVIKFISLDSLSYLSLLSKYPITYTDTVTLPVDRLLLTKLKALVATLPVQYGVYPYVFNSGLINTIKAGVNMGTTSQNAIDIFQNLLDLFDVGCILQNNMLYLFAVPENLENEQLIDYSTYIEKPPETIEDMIGLFYNNFTMKYTLTPGHATDLGPVTAGTGTVTKEVTCDNVFFDVAASAQKVIDRKNALFSTVWKTTDFNCKHEVNPKLGDYIALYGHAFIITSVEDAYTHYKIKVYGREL